MMTGEEARPANGAGTHDPDGEPPREPDSGHASGSTQDGQGGHAGGSPGQTADSGHGQSGEGGRVFAESAADADADAPSGVGSSDAFRPGNGPAGATDGAAAGVTDDEDCELSLEARLQAAEALSQERWERVLRLQAEMENQRKRAQKDVANAKKFSLERLVGDLLPVKDSLELGLGASNEEGASVESIREGIELTLKLLDSLLEKHQIAEIDPVGEKFDPEYHQAMSMQEVEGAVPNTVVSVLQKGYTLNERLVRPALVMVAR